jgi:hypothetical protein
VNKEILSRSEIVLWIRMEIEVITGGSGDNQNGFVFECKNFAIKEE